MASLLFPNLLASAQTSDRGSFGYKIPNVASPHSRVLFYADTPEGRQKRVEWIDADPWLDDGAPVKDPYEVPSQYIYPEFSAASGGRVPTAAELIQLGDGFVNSLNKQNNMLSRMLYHQAVDKMSSAQRWRHELVLAMPHIMGRESARAEHLDAARSARYLEDCMYHYLSRLKNDDPLAAELAYFINLDWVLGFQLAQAAHWDLVKNALNEPAKQQLQYLLARENMFRDRPMRFDFTKTPPVLWDNYYIQHRAVNFFTSLNGLKSLFGYRSPHNNSLLNEPDYDDYSLFSRIHPLFSALGDFTMRAMPVGFTVPQPDGSHRVCVTDIYTFSYDTYNFEDHEYLATWNLERKAFTAIDPADSHLTNGHFRRYQETGYGHVFPVVSPLKKMDNFQKQCWIVKPLK